MPCDRRPLGLERAAAGGDRHAFGFEDLAAGGADAELPLAEFFQRRHHLAEMERRAERMDLLHQRVGQALSGDDGQARNVVDRLFRIKLGALPAGPVEDVDQMRLDVEQAELEHREQADRACADDQHVGFDGFAHWICPGC